MEGCDAPRRGWVREPQQAGVGGPAQADGVLQDLAEGIAGGGEA